MIPGNLKTMSLSREDMFAAAFEYALQPFAILDRKFSFIRVNDAFAKLGDRTAEEYTGRNFFEFFPSAENVNIFMRVLNTRIPYKAWSRPAAYLGIKEAGYLDWFLSPVPEKSGEIAWLFLILNNATEREQNRLEYQRARDELESSVQQRTRELQKSQEASIKYQNTLELALAATGQGTWDWDIQAGTLTLSRRCKELFGLNPDEEMSFESSMDAILPEDQDRVREAVIAALVNRTQFDVEMRVKLPDEYTHYLRSTGRAYYNEKGEAVRVAGTTWDITDSRKIRGKLKESEERLRLAMSVADEAVWDWDCAGDHVVYNEIYKERFGRDEDDSSSKWWLEHLHPDDVERVRETMGRALKGPGDRWSADYRFRMKDGSYAHVSDRAFLIRDESGRVRRVVGAMLDLSERKRIEEELEKRTRQLVATNQELESFSYVVSHDLRSPVRAMEGYTKMILKDYGDRFDNELKRRFSVIIESTGKMNEMIEAMLVLARASNAEMMITDCDMKRIFQEAWEGLLRENPGRKFKFTLGDLPKIQADCRLMNQVASNLLSNAVKFTRDREEAIIEVGGGTGGEYTFYVKDNGTGFDMKYYDRLFTAFQRLHNSKEYAGIGIGLPIVQRIILRHGGKLWAEGEVNKGSIFYFSLPKQASRPA